ncbi:MAG: hypothetical protein Q8O76_10995 [Chloroflexota bacterium]|nr:hypothetical protein [Chloroflexota bacterium]
MPAKLARGAVLIRQADMDWLERVACPIMGVERVYVQEEPTYQGKYPDIWSVPGKKLIVVTPEWARQRVHERRSRLGHELVHLLGYPHRPSKGFYSRPDKDRFGKQLYWLIVRESRNQGGRGRAKVLELLGSLGSRG